MVRTVFVSLWVLLLGHSKADCQNLLQNWSLEERHLDSIGNSLCPVTTNEIAIAESWDGIRSVDYFHSCSNSTSNEVGTPGNIYGYQLPFDGEGYGVIGCYIEITPNYREYLWTQLGEPLVEGQSYILRFRLSLADSVNFAISSISALFTPDDTRFWFTEDFITQSPQVHFQQLLDDQTGWMVIESGFVADGTEQFLTIGSFLKDEFLGLEVVNNHGDYWNVSAYYIDGLELILSENLAAFDREIGTLKLFPNPSSNLVTIELNSYEVVRSVLILNLQGKLVATLKSSSNSIDVSELPNGAYTLMIATEDNLYRSRLLKH